MGTLKFYALHRRCSHPTRERQDNRLAGSRGEGLDIEGLGYSATGSKALRETVRDAQRADT